MSDKPSCGSQKPGYERQDPFTAILDEIQAMHDKKGADYGTDEDPLANIKASEDFGIPGWQGAVLRANDKMSRLKTFAKKGTLENEPVEDSLLDLGVYAIIALQLYRESLETTMVTAGRTHEKPQ